MAPGAGLGIQDIAYQQFLQAVNSAAASAFGCFLGLWLFTASVQRWKPSIIYLVDLWSNLRCICAEDCWNCMLWSKPRMLMEIPWWRLQTASCRLCGRWRQPGTVDSDSLCHSCTPPSCRHGDESTEISPSSGLELHLQLQRFFAGAVLSCTCCFE